VTRLGIGSEKLVGTPAPHLAPFVEPVPVKWFDLSSRPEKRQERLPALKLLSLSVNFAAPRLVPFGQLIRSLPAEPFTFRVIA